MKTFILACVGVIATTCINAQTYLLPESGVSAETIVPKGWTFLDCSGDLNKDSILDLVIITRSQNPENIIVRDDDYDYNFNPSILAIYWGSKEGIFRRFGEWDNVLDHTKDEYVSVHNKLAITPKGMLDIHVEDFLSEGSWGSSSAKYRFRYQNDDFYCIGCESFLSIRSDNNITEQSVNFLTGKCKITTQKLFVDSETGKAAPPKIRWKTFEKKPLQRLKEMILSSSGCNVL